MSVGTSVASGAASGAAAGTAVMPGWGTAIGAVAGAAISYFGASESEKATKQAAEAQAKQIELEKKAESVRRQFMEIQSRRSSLENIRSVQRAQALALNNAITQGAQFGSGLQGGLGQISAQGAYNEQGIAQSLMTGRSLFDINSQLTGAKLQEMMAKQGMQEGAAYSSLGNAVTASAPKLGQLIGSKPPSQPYADNSTNPYSYAYQS